MNPSFHVFRLCSVAQLTSVFALVGLVTSTLVAGDTDADIERHALLIGISKYHPDRFEDLPGAASDVESLGRVLTQCGFDRDRVTVMTGAAGSMDPRKLPTAARIRKQLKRFVRDPRPSDIVVLALAGHGVQPLGKEYYFCPQDADLRKPESLISIAEIYRALDQCDAKFKLLLIDACRENTAKAGMSETASGGIASVTRSRKSDAPNLPEPPARTAAFFSCSPGQMAYERNDAEESHGVFFHAILRGLEGAAAGEDGSVTLPDLERFVKKDVEAFVRKTYSATQHPVIRNNTIGLVPLVTFSLSNRKIQEAWYLWARARKDEARAIVDNLLAKRPNDALALAERSRMLSEDAESEGKLDALDEAFRLAEQAVNLAPNEAGPYIARAAVYRVREDYEKSLADCSRAIQCDPNCAMAYVQRSVIHQHNQDHDAMLEDIRMALEIDNKEPTARTLHAGLLFSLNRMEEGFVELERGIALTPDVPMLHFMKGYGLDQQGNYDKAILSYTAAIRLDDSDDDLYCRRAVSLANAGDYEGAMQDASSAERINPDNPDVTSARIVALSHQQKYAEAIQVLNQALKRHTDSQDLIFGRGCAYFYTNQIDKALADFARVIELNPAYANAHALIGVIKMQSRQFDEAMVHLNRATRYDENHVLAHYSKAAILIQQNDFAGAVPHLDRAIECDPNNALWVQQRGMILKRLGRHKEAQRDMATYTSMSK